MLFRSGVEAMRNGEAVLAVAATIDRESVTAVAAAMNRQSASAAVVFKRGGCSDGWSEHDR